MSDKDHSSCKAMLSSLSDYVDGTLSDELCQEIDRHLADCQDCTIMVDTLRKTVSIVHRCAEDEAEAPAPVRARLYKTLNLDNYIKH
jgi:anti-sigma factor (TIGR02949 family)